jgi:tetratricopeptide (TPR) repeat protein
MEKAACDTQGRRMSRSGQVVPGSISVIGKALVPTLTLIAVALLAFLPVLGNDFVDWDDDKNFLANPSYRGLGRSNLAWALTTFHLGVYQPLAWMLFELEYTLCGVSPRGYHMASLVLHMAVGVSLYFLTVRLLFRAWPEAKVGNVRLAAWLATAIFLVHPLRVEVVAWASCQGYLSCALFAILAVMAYERLRPADVAEQAPYGVAAFLFYGASLLCHATAIGLPLVLLILDWYPFRRFGSRSRCWRAVWEKWPFLLTAAAFTVIGYVAKGSSVKTLDQHGAMTRAGQACYSAVYYLLKTALPIGLHAHHPLPSQLSLADPRLSSSLIAIGLLSAGALRSARTRPAFAAAWFSYLALLAPSSGLITFGGQLVADRYSYLPGVVWSIAGSYLLAKVLNILRLPALALCIVVVATFAGLNRKQCLTWRDSISLWRNVLAWDDSSPTAHLNFGKLLAHAGQPGEAFRHFQASAKLDPTSPDPYLNLGVLVAQRGRLSEVRQYVDEALKRGLPAHDGLSWLALVLSDHGRTSEALPFSEKAIREAPDSGRIQYTHGTILARLGRFKEAVAYLTRASELDPRLVAARLDLGLVLSDLGRLNQAETVLRDVLRHDPQSATAHIGLGEPLVRRGDRSGASQQFRQALAIDPARERAAEGLRRIAEESTKSR